MRRVLKFMTVFATASLFGSLQTASAQQGLVSDPNKLLDVQKLTCGELANTYQEDADALAYWYSGWYNGLGRKHTIKLSRVKGDQHEVIVYCKAHPDTTVIKAIDVIFKTQPK